MNNSRKNKRRRQGQDNSKSAVSGGGDDDDDDDDDAYQKAYSTVRFHPIASTGRPGTPHRYFAESYAVEEITTSQKQPPQSSLLDEGQEKKQQQKKKHQQVVHKHANGLVIVTAGDADSLLSCSLSTPAIGAVAASSSSSSSATREHNDNNEQQQQQQQQTMKTIQSIDFMVQEAAVAAQNASCKRKQQAKMLKGKAKVQEEEGVVRPLDILAHVHVQMGSSSSSGGGKNESLPLKEEGKDETAMTADTHCTIPLSCCVWGTILERNVHLQKNPSLLQQDPLLDGYLAVVLPTGPFPPSSSPTR